MPEQSSDRSVSLTSEDQRQALLDFAISQSSAIFYIADLAGGRPVRFIGQNVKALTGFEPEAFLDDISFGRSLVHPEDLALFQRRIPQLAERGSLIHEYRMRCADGEYRWFRDEQRVVPSSNGGAQEFMGCMTDITDRVDAEQESRRLARLMRHAVDSIPNGFAIYTADDELALCNLAFADTIEDEPENLVGSAVVDNTRRLLSRLERIDAKRVHDVEASLTRVLARRRESEHEPIELELAGGTWLQVTSHPLARRRQGRYPDRHHQIEAGREQPPRQRGAVPLHRRSQPVSGPGFRYRDLGDSLREPGGRSFVRAPLAGARRSGDHAQLRRYGSAAVGDRHADQRTPCRPSRAPDAPSRRQHLLGRALGPGGALPRSRRLCEQSRGPDRDQGARTRTLAGARNAPRRHRVAVGGLAFVRRRGSPAALQCALPRAQRPLRGSSDARPVMAGSTSRARPRPVSFADAEGRVDEWVEERRAKRGEAAGGLREVALLGGERWVEIAHSRTSRGGTVHTWRDITESRRMAEELREGEERVRKVLENCPLPVRMWRLDSHDVIYESPASRAMSGETPPG